MSAPSRPRHRLMAPVLWLIGLLCLALLPAQAWKPKTHIYVADVIMDDARDGKVWIPPFGEFTIRPEAATALRNKPDFFRAGAVGPDGFPDMFTGQMYIHNPRTNQWLTHLWNMTEKTPNDENWAFTLGYFAHCGGDMWAHDWVNYYAGRDKDYDGRFFPPLGDVANDPRLINVIRRHLAVEATLDKRIPPCVRTIDIPNDFVFRAMVIDPGAQAAQMNPLIKHYVDLYWQKEKCKNDKAVDFLGVTVPTYNAYWFQDLDLGLRKWVDANETAIKQAVEPENGEMVTALKDNLCDWAIVHVLDMEGVPSVARWLGDADVALSNAAKRAFEGTELYRIVKETKEDFVNYMMKKTVGVTQDELKAWFSGDVQSTGLFPTKANEILTEIGTIPQESAWVHANTDHARFRQFVSNINGPLYNSVILGKIALLTPAELDRLMREQNNVATQPKNVLLGVIEGIDLSNQWSANNRLHLLDYEYPGKFPVFGYVFKPYAPINRNDTSPWQQRKPMGGSLAWNNGFQALIEGNLTAPNGRAANGGYVFVRKADNRTGAWEVMLTPDANGKFSQEVPVELGKGYLIRPVHNLYNFGAPTTATFTTPVDLIPVVPGRAVSAAAVRKVATPTTTAPASTQPTAGPGGRLTPPKSSSTSPAPGSPSFKQPAAPGPGKAVTEAQEQFNHLQEAGVIDAAQHPDWFEDPGVHDAPTAPTASVVSTTSACALAPFPQNALAVTGNVLGLPSRLELRIAGCQATGTGVGTQGLWMTGMTGTVTVRGIGDATTPLATITFTIDDSGKAIWNCGSYQELRQLTANPAVKRDRAYLEVGGHPGLLSVDMKPTFSAEVLQRARIAHAYRQVSAAFTALPAAVRGQAPYQAVSQAIDNLPAVFDEPLRATGALRGAIAALPNVPHRDLLVKAWRDALAAFPGDYTYSYKYIKNNFDRFGNPVPSIIAATFVWTVPATSAEVLVQPDLNRPDTDANPPTLTAAP